MKRLLCIFISFSLLLGLWACSAPQEPVTDPVRFYYPRLNVTYGNAASVISSEIRESYGHQGSLSSLLQLYLRGPVSEDLYSPFPTGSTLVQAEVAEDTLNVILSNSFAGLTGLDLRLACAALAKTCLELTDVTTIRISIEDGLLDGEKAIIISEDSLVLLDESAAAPETTNN